MVVMEESYQMAGLFYSNIISFRILSITEWAISIGTIPGFELRTLWRYDRLGQPDRLPHQSVPGVTKVVHVYFITSGFLSSILLESCQVAGKSIKASLARRV
jgi:hypothetical protein